MAADGVTGSLAGAFSRAVSAYKLAALALLFILLAAAVASISNVLTGPNLGLLLQSLLFGLLVGWGMALFRQPAWRAILVAATLGFIYIFLFPAGLIWKTMAVLVEVPRLLPKGFDFLGKEAGDLTSLTQAVNMLVTSTGIVIARIQAWIVALVDRQPAFDPVAAALIWNACVWLVAAWAGWIIEARRNTLLATLPAILLSLSTLAYGQRTPLLIYLILGSLLLLLAIVQQGQREQAWVDAGVAYPMKKGRQIIYVSLLVTLALVSISSLTASISIHRIQEWLSELTKSTSQQDNGELGKSLGIIPGNTAIPDMFKTVRSPGLPQGHLIGSGPELSQHIVMTVSVDDLALLNRGGQPLPLYWRGLTYDTYTGNGWRTSGTTPDSYDANQLIQANHAPHHILIQQKVRLVENLGGKVYAAGELVSINHQSEAAWRSSADLFGIQMDKSGSYDALSLIPVVDVYTLRAAGQEYPDWVRARYLALPRSTPEPIKTLAIELTASEPTPYDRAKAIEGYLRTFPYTLDVPRPPSNRDVADYFLFDLKMGYCDYYATSMVVLARAAGLPARLATGYANGTYNLNSKRFVITEADAHSWVEVYFPKIGWVPFEPTANRPLIERKTALAPAVPALRPTPVTPQGGAVLHVWGWLLAGTGSIALLGILWALVDEIRLRRMEKQMVAVEIYRRLKRYGKSLDASAELSDTPYEFSTCLSIHLEKTGFKNQKPEFIFGLIHDIQTVTDEIVWTSYRPLQSDSLPDARVLQHWSSLRWKLRRLLILYTWEKYIGNASRVWGAKLKWRNDRYDIKRSI